MTYGYRDVHNYSTRYNQHLCQNGTLYPKWVQSYLHIRNLNKLPGLKYTPSSTHFGHSNFFSYTFHKKHCFHLSILSHLYSVKIVGIICIHTWVEWTHLAFMGYHIVSLDPSTYSFNYKMNWSINLMNKKWGNFVDQVTHDTSSIM